MIKQIKENKYLKSLLVLIMLVLVALIARVTYAYFQMQREETGPTSLDVNVHETIALQFIPGNPLEMDVNKSTLPKGGENLEVVSNPRVKLLLDDYYDIIHYNVYFTINENNFDYTTLDEIPEIILTITDPDGEEITDIPGLTHIGSDSEKYQGVAGFDVTRYSGTVAVKENQEISLAMVQNTNMEQSWTFTLTYINLDYNQSANLDKSLKVEIKMQQSKYSIEEEPPVDQPEYEKTITRLLADANKEGETPTLIKHSSDAMADIEIANEDLIAGDNSYRYSGSSEAVKNYVCLDGTSEDGECQNGDADLYRIIGLFPNETGEYEMKLIKYTTYVDNSAKPSDYTASGKGYNWSSFNNVWKNSTLNTDVLNISFYDSLLPYQNLIADHTYVTAGNYDLGEKNVYNAYQAEIKTPETNIYYTPEEAVATSKKIGLMYVSDYGYAAYQDAWTQKLVNYSNINIKNNNWMFINENEWTITRRPCDSLEVCEAFFVYNDGGVRPESVYGFSMFAVRPVFYLESSTKIESGDGSKTSPYRMDLS